MPDLDRRTMLLSTGSLAAMAALAACSGSPSETPASSGGAAPKVAADFTAARGAQVKIEVLPYDQIRTVVDRRLQATRPPTCSGCPTPT